MINIIAVGKLQESYFKEAVNEYLKRLSGYTKVNIYEINECKLHGNNIKDILKVINVEGDIITKKLTGYTIALDSRGENFTSLEFAEFIDQKHIQGISELTFIIGGSYGLSEKVLDKCKKILSFGSFTYPHQMMRMILIEQIYRAYTIISGSKYHK